VFELLAALALGYLLGAIPSAALLAQAKGRRIFEVGSGNMGAMNTARNLGYLLGGLVLVMDIGKGALATLLAQLMTRATNPPGIPTLGMVAAAGVGAVLGHAWSAYINFRGGKGLATTLGISLPLYPLAGLYGLGILIALVLLVRRANLAAVVAIISYPLVVLATLRKLGWPQDDTFTILTSVILIAVIVLLKYLPALRRGEKPLF